ncbi:hypothetical protein N7532_008967 [Penicillium argentinense]|uniref:Uncharacterized protein n=1 Tax=Penicillium argentinense TaxID=1131581 RepID=A0A9W9K260_9EURO|nr:uncharacterized protein N7532_008967 [Penicillium argentinense]KAJ5090283.1 hypothetical protein N7532_008967 [Penicillium argentinense]
MENQGESAFANEDIYPLHALDNNPNWVVWVMRFNDVLDAKKLNDSLSRLLDIGDWRKLSGRIRCKVRLDRAFLKTYRTPSADTTQGKNKWEIHVQKSSTIDKENVSFSHDVHDVAIQDHPIGKQLPRQTDGPSTQPITNEFRPFAAKADHPRFEELTKQDIAPMFLHVTSFRDATIASLVWPHMLMDAVGGQALLAAWSSVLAGREDEVPGISGAREDILQHPSITAEDDDDKEEFILERIRLKGFSVLRFHLRLVWDKIWNGRRERRAIFLPKSFYEKIKTRAQQEIRANAPETEPVPFVSEGDILTAWTTRAIALSEPNSRSVAIMNYINLRYLLPLLLQSSGVFLQNMVLASYTFLSSKVAKGPVGPIAADHRQSVSEQLTERQSRKFLKSVMADINADRSPRILFGESDSIFIIVNNLTKAKLIQTAKFGPAVITQGEKTEARQNPLGSMVNYYSEFLHLDFEGINCFYMLGKDHAENYWLMGKLLPRAWDAIERELRDLEA